MKRGKIEKSLLLILVLFMSACSQTQVNIPIVKKVHSEVKEQNVTAMNLIILSSKLITTNQTENWIPLKIEDEIEWNAKELLGKKYVWGATGPNTYDCSGFTQKIYDDLGIQIPRVSKDQAEHGKLLQFDDLKKGDLVFFQTNKRRPGLVTHVGIYLGHGDFIHASSGAKKIVICNFKKDFFYKKRFLWGRRVIENKQHIAITQKLKQNLKSL